MTPTTSAKPTKSILDRSFVYIPAAATSVDLTWRRFGWRPLTEMPGAPERGRQAMELAAQVATRQ